MGIFSHIGLLYLFILYDFTLQTYSGKLHSIIYIRDTFKKKDLSGRFGNRSGIKIKNDYKYSVEYTLLVISLLM